jgi:hypothetical protein
LHGEAWLLPTKRPGIAPPATTLPQIRRSLEVPFVTTANDLRAEAAKMREFARWVTDPEVLGEIRLMIAELERRARKLGDGDAGP